MIKTLKTILVIIILVLFTFLVLAFYLDWNIMGSSESKSYTKQSLITNYNNKKQNLTELKEYYNKLVPTDKVVEIEFENDETIAILEVTNLASKTNNYHDKFLSGRGLNINSLKIDSLLKTLGWTNRTLSQLKIYLDRASCVSIANGEPTRIGFQRSGFGMYFYDLFSKPIPDSLRPKYNDSCIHILYNDYVALEYGGGVTGSVCFPKD